jgi:serine/threonine-protein kinase RsbW
VSTWESDNPVINENSPDAELRLPADSAYLAVLRTATAGLAARINFTLDDIEDLRIAVDEACAILLPQARPETELDCRFWLGQATMTVAVGARCDDPQTPNEQGFAWRVLSALTTFATSMVEGDRLVLTLSRSAGRHP